MGISNLWGIYGVRVGTTDIGGITSVRIPLETEVNSEGSSGDHFAREQYIRSQTLGAEFTTMEIIKALTAIKEGSGSPLLGAKVATSNVTLYAREKEKGGTRLTSGRSYVYATGVIVPQRLSIDSQGFATLSYALKAVSADGSTAPVVIADGQALPALVAGERFGMGPVRLQNVSIGQVTNLELDFGIDVAVEGADGDLYATFAYLRTVNPVLTVRGKNVVWLDPTAGGTNVPLLGKVLTHAGPTSLFLRKRKPGGVYEPDASAVHVKMTFAGTAVIDTPYDGSAQGDVETAIRVPLQLDTSNDPLIITTGVAVA